MRKLHPKTNMSWKGAAASSISSLNNMAATRNQPTPWNQPNYRLHSNHSASEEEEVEVCRSDEVTHLQKKFSSWLLLHPPAKHSSDEFSSGIRGELLALEHHFLIWIQPETQQHWVVEIHPWNYNPPKETICSAVWMYNFSVVQLLHCIPKSPHQFCSCSYCSSFSAAV